MVYLPILGVMDVKASMSMLRNGKKSKEYSQHGGSIVLII